MRPAAQILLVEADALPAVLAGLDRADFDRQTVCAGWSVGDVLAHCAAALASVVTGEPLDFSPAGNQRGVEIRRDVPTTEVIDELLDAYAAAAEAIDRAGGALDGLGLGEWVHGGDVRDALDIDDAYGSAGIDLAVPLILERSFERAAPGISIDFTDTGEELAFGVGQTAGALSTDRATFVRLVAGRRPDPARYELRGIEPRDLVLFG